MTGPAPLLEVEDVVLRFGGVTALDGVTFDVRPSELFAIIGPNGAGKTSIFNCLNSVYRPTTGHIRFDGVDLGGVSPAGTARLGIGRTFQNLGLFVNLTLVDNLMLGRHHLMHSGFVAGMLWWGRAKREELAHRVRVEQIVELLELGPYRHAPVGMLPYGIQKRIELSDFRANALSYRGDLVELSGWLSPDGDLLMLGADAADPSPIPVEYSNLPRRAREDFLVACGAGCEAVVQGRVRPVNFTTGQIEVSDGNLAAPRDHDSYGGER